MISWFLRFFKKQKSSSAAFVSPVAVARWCIQQFCTCPFCQHENDIIEINLRRKINQGRMTVHQKQVSKYDKDKFEYEDVSVDIPTPPYIGAMLENTENLDERFDCENCGNTIHIHEAHWGYGK